MRGDLADRLTRHIDEMIQLEYGVKIDKDKYISILTDEDADNLHNNWNNFPNIRAIYISRNVFLPGKQKFRMELPPKEKQIAHHDFEAWWRKCYNVTMKRILTYGTFDLLHFGHIEILRRAKAQGDYLVVAVSTDKFNTIKNKKAYHNYETRKKMLEAVRYVDLVIPENTWEQKRNDVKEYHIDAVVMGSDWEGDEKFECLRDLCDVIYLPRTEGISTTKIKKDLGLQRPNNSTNLVPKTADERSK